MADQNTTPPAAKSATPKIVQMHRTVHEVATGPKPENKIEPGTFVTDDVAKDHKLDAKALNALTETGALELVEVHKA